MLPGICAGLHAIACGEPEVEGGGRDLHSARHVITVGAEKVLLHCAGSDKIYAMPDTKPFTAGGQQVTITANDDGSLEAKVSGHGRTYDNLDDLLHFQLVVFQQLYPQLRVSLAGSSAVWNQALAPALDTLRSTYPDTLLGGTLGAKDPHALGAEPMKVVETVTSAKFQTWSFSTNSLAAVQAAVLQVNASRDGITKQIQRAQLYSDRALNSKSGKRVQAQKAVDASATDLAQLEKDLELHQAQLAKLVRELEASAKGRFWMLSTKQPDAGENKTFRVKIKQGKFRQLVFFSRHRHSIPYYLTGQVGDDGAFLAGPQSKFLNTLTILTAGELETAFTSFVRDVYVPFLNLGDRSVRKYTQDYQPPQNHPMFHAEKYYSDQGMHCTPVSTPGVAFTLTQQEHALFYAILPYIRDPGKAITAGDANSIAGGLRGTTAESEFAKMTLAYPKLTEILRALSNRGKAALQKVPAPNKPTQDAIKNLQNAIRDFAGTIKIQL